MAHYLTDNFILSNFLISTEIVDEKKISEKVNKIIIQILRNFFKLSDQEFEIWE